VVTPAHAAIIYAIEVDLLNGALFGQTARQWQKSDPERVGNMREHATVERLHVLANIEGMNSELIDMGFSQGERLKRLNQIAISQMHVLAGAQVIK